MSTRGHLFAQSAVTTTVTYPHDEVAKRRMAAKTSSIISYPGGDDVNNLRVARNEFIIGRKKQRGVRVPGRPLESGFSSFNGMSLANAKTAEDFMEDLYFIGVSKTDFNPADPLTPQNGLAVLRVGTADPFYTGSKPVCPGDLLVLRAPPVNASPNSIPQWDGKPREKIPPRIEPLDLHEADNVRKYSIHLATTHNLQEGGVSRKPLSDLTSNSSGLTRLQKLALAEKQSTLGYTMYGIHALSQRGLIRINTPEVREQTEKAVKAAKALGDLVAGMDAKIDTIKTTVVTTDAVSKLSGSNEDKAKLIVTAALEALVADLKTSIQNQLDNLTNLTINGIAEKEDERTDVIKNTKLTLDTNMAMSKLNRLPIIASKKLSLAQIQEFERHRERSLLWLSTLLGLTRSASNYLDPSEVMQNEVLATIHSDVFLATEGSPLYIPALPNLRNEYEASGHIHAKKMIASYTKMGRSFVTVGQYASNEYFFSTFQNCVGTSLSFVNPTLSSGQRDRIDILVGVGSPVF